MDSVAARQAGTKSRTIFQRAEAGIGRIFGLGTSSVEPGMFSGPRSGRGPSVSVKPKSHQKKPNLNPPKLVRGSSRMTQPSATKQIVENAFDPLRTGPRRSSFFASSRMLFESPTLRKVARETKYGLYGMLGIASIPFGISYGVAAMARSKNRAPVVHTGMIRSTGQTNQYYNLGPDPFSGVRFASTRRRRVT